MKVWISVDMEGISGLVRWADVISTGMDFQRNRRFMTQDANAAIAGAFDAGATEVVVEENHGVEELCDLVLDEIDPRCRVVRGAGRPSATTMAGLDARHRGRAVRRPPRARRLVPGDHGAHRLVRALPRGAHRGRAGRRVARS